MAFEKEISYYLQLDHPCIFLPAVQQAPRTTITGQFHLSLSTAALFKSIRVRVIGRLRIPSYGLFSTQKREEITLDETQNLAHTKSIQAIRLPEGDYEFAFAIALPRVALDTLVGPGHEYHSYAVEVVIQRSGFLKRDLVVSENLRIYKLHGPERSMGRGSQAVEGYSDKGMQYHISVPDTAVPHGSSFPVEGWFVPQTKGIILASVTVKVVESHDLKFEATAAEAGLYDMPFVTWNAYHVIFEKSVGVGSCRDGGMGTIIDICQISVPVQLPRQAEACSQSYSSNNIKIEHCLLLTAEVLGADGKYLETITVRIPLHIYMAPATTLEERCESTGDEQSVEHCCSPPPIYGKHELDRVVTQGLI
ncbi:hypothetical protein BJY04DRAFT_199861 [Aspergillus karnatakaensis]|uniref:arrestin C-terminal domain-containing protein n=1 Tax=Aspergillus karnatakaensis TaxID=1810916 RepID=UPI003CCDA8E2